MAEFCLDCFNKLNNTNHKPYEYVLSKELDLCEGCGKLTHVIVTKRNFCFRKFMFSNRKK